MRISRPIGFLIYAAALLSCSQSSVTEPGQAVAATPTFNFANGPSELPNVIRFSSNDGGFFIPDDNSGLIVVEGLPTDPRTLFLCEGQTNPASTLNWQTIGWLRDVIHVQQVGKDVNVHVYRLSDVDFNFPGDPFLHLWCTGTPIAAGTGRARAIDNDFFATGGKNNAVSIQIRGMVTDPQTDELLRLKAGFHVVQNIAGFPDVPPTLKVLKTHVQLELIGGS
jgi:hypothetical protein